MECLSCKKETDNPKFCSRSCAAISTNKTYPKKKTKKKCTVCGEPVKSYRYTKCPKHWEEYVNSIPYNYKNATLAQYQSMASVKNRHPSWTNSHVRNFAKSWLKHLRSEPCRHCGYNKHVELAHIKAITEFSLDTTLGEINAENNIIPLCPNCHWEFDNLPRNLNSSAEI